MKARPEIEIGYILENIDCKRFLRKNTLTKGDSRIRTDSLEVNQSVKKYKIFTLRLSCIRSI